jgi:ParB-like chromosome segregation protein Spo0J
VTTREKGNGGVSSDLGARKTASGLPELVNAQVDQSKQESIFISSLLPADSPRTHGEDETHILRLAESDAELPPILVQRHTMRVIDGMHRIRAAQLNGLEKIAVTYFDGSDEDAFLLGVKLNVAHGLPLSLPDRKTAAARILTAQPYLSDRAVALVVGLSSKTVAALRPPCANVENPRLHTRLGADGRQRPLDSAEGRKRAAEVIAETPKASLRYIAASSGISPGTARDVRNRLERGQDPVSKKPRARRSRPASGCPLAGFGAVVLPPLDKDPSLRLTEGGRELLRWLHAHVIRAEDWIGFVGAVPPHCSPAVVDLARQSADAWTELARQLEQSSSARHSTASIHVEPEHRSASG